MLPLLVTNTYWQEFFEQQQAYEAAAQQALDLHSQAAKS